MSHTTLLLVLVILASSVVSQQQQPQDDTPDICLSLRESTACPAFHQFYVSTGVVDRYPFLPNNITSVEQFDASLLRYVNSTSDYLLPLGCLSSNYNPTTPYARYALTKMCARLIQDAEDSLPCNTEHNVVPPPLCQATCMDWVNSVTTITSQPRVCSDNSQRTAALSNYTTQCLSWQGYNASTNNNCISGFANEPDNCGFRDDITRACQFCQNTTNAASSNCCQLVTCGHGLGIASIIGTAIGTLMALVLLISAGYCLYSRYFKSRLASTSSPSSTSLSTNKKNHASTTSSYFSDSKTALHDPHHHRHSSIQWSPDSMVTTNNESSVYLPSPVSLSNNNHHHHHYSQQQQQQQQEEDYYVVVHAYPPQMDDELALSVGDVIMLALPFDDGWALGVNLSTGLKGAFPLVCVSPTTLTFMEQWQARASRLTVPSPTTVDVSSSSIPKRMASKSSKSSSSSDFISPFLDSHRTYSP